jgi:hypothetical protein
MFAFESTLFVIEEGTVISKAPRKEIPNNVNNAKTKRLKIALLEMLYNVLLPKAIVSNKPNKVKMVMMEIEYNMAFLTP